MIDEKWTLQSIFDHVSKHLIEQNAKAERNYYCLGYDPLTGRRCAAGCLIPIETWQQLSPEYYSKGHEWVYPFILVELYDNDGKMKNLISILQGVHDALKLEEWRGALIKIGKNWNLTIPEWLKD